MTATESEAILTLSIMAGFADGVNNDAERAQFKRIAETLPQAELQPADLYHRVLLQQVTITQTVEPLKTAELRQYAYEMAVCICDADQVQTDAERKFLFDLRTSLKLEPEKAAALQEQRPFLQIKPWTRGGLNE